MLALPLARHLDPERTSAALLAVGAVGASGLLALVDPSTGGGVPLCPVRAILGIDCPACGTLRGLHALANGHMGTALDHNVLLAVAVPVALIVWYRWICTAVGRPPRQVVVPAWLPPTMAVLGIAFAIVRNLPVHGLAWLNSAA